jgi:hypothetical protein
MNAYDYDAVVYKDEVYCVECLPKNLKKGEEVFPIFADSEWDYPPVCTICKTAHTYMTILKDNNYN